MQVFGGMDAGKKPTGTYLWCPAIFRAYSQVRLQDLPSLNYTMIRILAKHYLYLTDIKCSAILPVLFYQ